MTEELPPVDERPSATNDAGLNVRKSCCGRCLFGPRPHVPWSYGKKKAEAALAEGRHFTCHEFDNVMCHGFYQRHGDKLWYVRLAKATNALNLVD